MQLVEDGDLVFTRPRLFEESSDDRLPVLVPAVDEQDPGLTCSHVPAEVRRGLLDRVQPVTQGGDERELAPEVLLPAVEALGVRLGHKGNPLDALGLERCRRLSRGEERLEDVGRPVLPLAHVVVPAGESGDIRHAPGSRPQLAPERLPLAQDLLGARAIHRKQHRLLVRLERHIWILTDRTIGLWELCARRDAAAALSTY